MKKLFIAMVLSAGIAGYSQDNFDFKHRTADAVDFVEWNAKKGYDGKTPEESFANLKVQRLLQAVELTEEQKKKCAETFKGQFQTLKDAWATYSKSKSTQAKIDLIKTLLKIEEQNRSLLTDRQLIYYKSYWHKDHMNSDYTNFKEFFMPEHIYYGYQKELL